MAIDPRFQWSRERVLTWYASPAQEGRWYCKDDFPKGLARNQEAVARRSRELVQLGRLDVKKVGSLHYYRFPTPTQRGAMPEQRALL